MQRGVRSLHGDVESFTISSFSGVDAPWMMVCWSNFKNISLTISSCNGVVAPWMTVCRSNLKNTILSLLIFRATGCSLLARRCGVPNNILWSDLCILKQKTLVTYIFWRTFCHSLKHRFSTGCFFPVSFCEGISSCTSLHFIHLFFL